MNNKLHIVSFDIPYPPNYGGVIDVFYKILHLSRAGIDVYLHCFQYGKRSASPELESLCKQVYYYKRKTGIRGLDPRFPYIVSSRANQELRKNLLSIEAPILFEGLHTCYYLNAPELSDRLKLVRAHNIEHEYYRQLTHSVGNIFSKLYFGAESWQLKNYENIIKHAQTIMPISRADYDYFSSAFPHTDLVYVPSFHKSDCIKSKLGHGAYCLYHGSLDVAENQEAAIFLAQKVWSTDMAIPLFIAGKHPSSAILALESANIKIIPNPSDEQMQQLVEDAHIIVLPTFQRSGLKLKLIDSLFNGRHIICNQNMLHGTLLSPLVTLADTALKFQLSVKRLITIPFDEKSLELRKKMLLEYDNKENALKIINKLH